MSTTNTSREESRLKKTQELLEPLLGESPEETSARQALEVKENSLKGIESAMEQLRAKLEALATAKAECEAKLALTDLPEEERKLTTEQLSGIPETQARLKADLAALEAELIPAQRELLEVSATYEKAEAKAEALRRPLLDRQASQDAALARKKVAAAKAKAKHERKFGKGGAK